jgi:hypothetical protein
VVAAGSNNIVSGYLDSTPNSTFLIQFFANAQSDHSDQRQGQFFLGETLVTTDQSGHATFSFTYTPQANAPLLSATATNYGNGNTSEFSRTIKESDDAGQLNIDGDGAQNAAPLFALGSRSTIVAGVPDTAIDANGRVALGSTGTVIFSSDRDAPLPGTFTATDRGVHAFAGLVLQKKGKVVLAVTDSLDLSLFDTLEIQVA